jgi:hypothetical protein
MLFVDDIDDMEKRSILIYSQKRKCLCIFRISAENFTFMTQLASLCAISTIPSSASPQSIQIQARFIFYELWTLHLFSAKVIKVATSREEQLQNPYSLPDIYSVTKSWRIIRQTRHKIRIKLMQNSHKICVRISEH